MPGPLAGQAQAWPGLRGNEAVRPVAQRGGSSRVPQAAEAEGQAGTYVAASRDMLNIVLGATLGLNVAVVQFFGDYLDLECQGTENNTEGRAGY